MSKLTRCCFFNVVLFYHIENLIFLEHEIQFYSLKTYYSPQVLQLLSLALQLGSEIKTKKKMKNRHTMFKERVYDTFVNIL